MTSFETHLTSFLACFIVIAPIQVHVTFWLNLVIQMQALVGIQYAYKWGKLHVL
jgi:hypothetical protein